MAQSSIGYIDDEEDPLPLATEERASTNLRSPAFQKPAVAEPAPQPRAQRQSFGTPMASALAGFSVPEAIPEQQPMPEPESFAQPDAGLPTPREITGADAPEVTTALQQYGQPLPEQAAPRPGYERTALKAQIQDERAYTQQQSGLHKFLKSRGVEMQTLPDGSEAVATHPEGTPRFKPTVSSPFKDEQTGRWLLRSRDDRGGVKDVDLLSTKGLTRTDPDTGDQYFVGPDKQPVVIGQDQSVIQRNQVLTERRNLDAQLQARDLHQQQIKADLEEPKQLFAQLQQSPVPVGEFGEAKSVKKLENIVTNLSGSVTAGTATDDDKETLRRAQEGLARFRQDRPEYDQLQQTIAAGHQTLAEMQETQRKDRARRLLLARDPKVSAVVSATLPDSLLVGGSLPGDVGTAEVENEMAAQASAQRTTQSKALPGILQKFKADGIQTIGGKPIDEVIAAAKNPPAPVARPESIAKSPEPSRSLWKNFIGTLLNTTANTGQAALETTERVLASGANKVGAAGAENYLTNAANANQQERKWREEATTGQFSPDNPFRPGGPKAGFNVDFKGANPLIPRLSAGADYIDPAQQHSFLTGAARIVPDLGIMLGTGGAAVPLLVGQSATSGAAEAGDQGEGRVGAGIKSAAKSALTMALFMGAGKIAGKMLPAIEEPLKRGLATAGISLPVNAAADAAINSLFGGQAIPQTPSEWAERGLFALFFSGHAGVHEAKVPSQITQALKDVKTLPEKIQLARAQMELADAARPLVEKQQDAETLARLEKSHAAADQFLKAQDPALVKSLDAKLKQAAEFAQKATDEAGPAAADPKATLATADDLTAKVKAAQANGDLPGVAALKTESQEAQAELHQQQQTAIGELAPGLRNELAKRVSPDADTQGHEKHFAENPDAAFMAAEVGRQVRDLYVAPERQAEINQTAERAGEHAPLAEYVADQHAGMLAARDLVNIATSGTTEIPPERVSALGKMGLVDVQETPEGQRLSITDDALALLPRGLQDQITRNPDGFRVKVTPGGVQDAAATLVRGGQSYFADALQGREMKRREADAHKPKPYMVRVEFKDAHGNPRETIIRGEALTEEQAVAGAAAKVEKGANKVTHAEVTTQEKMVARQEERAKAEKEQAKAKDPIEEEKPASGWKPATLDDFTEPEQRPIQALASVFDKNREFLGSIGIKGIALVKNAEESSGLATREDGFLLLDGSQLKEQFDTLSKIRDKNGKGVSSKQWAEKALFEEAIHQFQFRAAKAAGLDVQEHYAAIRNDPTLDPEMLKKAHDAYVDFDQLPDWKQGAELERMVLQQRWTGTITERLFRSIEHVLEYLKGITIESELLKSSIERVERLRDELQGKSGAERRTDSPASQPASQAGAAESSGSSSPESVAPAIESQAKPGEPTLSASRAREVPTELQAEARHLFSPRAHIVASRATAREALAGLNVTVEARDAETGERSPLTMPAAEAITELKRTRDGLEALLNCLAA